MKEGTIRGFVATLLLMSWPVFAGTIMVSGGGDAIQEAINAANPGDIIVAAPGTYSSINFNGKNITVVSTNPDDPQTVATTIIRQTGTGPVVTFFGSEDANCALEGFTITGGNNTSDDGGGVYGNGAGAAISNCIISNNHTEYNGGGLHRCHGPVSNCIISNNHAENSGGGLYDCDGPIFNCTVSDNATDDYGGTVCECDGPISNCSITDNITNAIGGALLWCSGPISNCTITGNSASRAAGLCGCDGTIRNCLIADNGAADEGAGLSYCSGLIIDCTITGNTAYRGGGLYECHGPISNCIIWGNQISQMYNCSAPSYSCVDAGAPGVGNISDDPLFVAPGAGDYHVQVCSPCINAGDPNFMPDPNETDIDGDARVCAGRLDMGADEYADHLVPIAHAGPNQYLKEIQLVTLDGSASYSYEPGGTMEFHWTQIAGPNVVLSDSNAVQPTFTPGTEAEYGFELVVSEGLFTGCPDGVLIVVGNRPPVADAGADIFCQVGQQVRLDGSDSYDPDPFDELTYIWTQLQGPNVVLHDANTLAPYFDCNEFALYEFELIVSDGLDDSPPATVQAVTVDVSIDQEDLDVDCNVSGYSYYNYPDISGTRVVYGMGYGCPLSWDIKSKELETGEVIEFGGGGVHTHPRIEGDIIVLYGGESSGDISAYDRSSISVYNAAGSTSQMTLRGYTATQSYSHPAIFGKKVVWLEHRNLDPSGVAQYYAPYNICGADITDLEHPTFFTIATNVGRRDVANRKVYGEFDDVVDISYNMVVWEGDGDIYGADISDLSNIRVFPICTHPARQFDPAIWNNIVVWTDQRNDEGDIYAADIRDTENIEIFEITREAGRQEQAAIEDRIIAYVDFVDPIGGDIGEIKLCWLTEQHGPLKIPLAVPQYGVQPRIDRNTIIWMGEDDYAGWAEAISVEIAYSIADGAVENVTKQERYDYIQHAIHQAQHDDEIVASEGVYIENINFQGKRLVVRSKDPADPGIVAATVISAGRHGAAVTFESSEGSSCMLRGFIIKGATLIAGYTPELGPDMGSGRGAIACFDLFRTGPVISDCLVTGNNCAGLYCYRSSPIVVNCAFAGNDSNGVELQGRSLAKFTNSVIVDNTRYGIFGAYPTVTNCTIVRNVLSAIASQAPNVRNSIVWDNASGDEQGQQIIDFEQRGSVMYSNVQGGWEDVGNIDVDPCFVDPCNGDYHLKSEAGRWDPDSESWVPDDVTSACIDKGNWSSSVGEEPYPNGGKINIGAYGGTAQASKSPVVTCWEALECAGQALGDATCDGRVDLADLFALKGSFGLSKGQAGYNCCVDFTHDDTVDISDLLTLKAGFGTSGYSPATRNQNCPP